MTTGPERQMFMQATQVSVGRREGVIHGISQHQRPRGKRWPIDLGTGQAGGKLFVIAFPLFSLLFLSSFSLSLWGFGLSHTYHESMTRVRGIHDRLEDGQTGKADRQIGKDAARRRRAYGSYK